MDALEYDRLGPSLASALTAGFRPTGCYQVLTSDSHESHPDDKFVQHFTLIVTASQAVHKRSETMINWIIYKKRMDAASVLGAVSMFAAPVLSTTGMALIWRGESELRVLTVRRSRC